jgi:type IX secretion system PorP/SprF family membrane protein
MLCGGMVSQAQQLPQFTQFREVLSYHNPAATSAFGTSAALAGRHQWIGLTDSIGNKLGPETYLFSLDIPLNNDKNGIGIMGMYDQLGWEETMFLRLNAAHHFVFGKKSRISVGASIDYQYKSFDFGLPGSIPGFNPGFAFQSVERAGAADVGAGLLYSHENGLFAGVSAHNLLRSNVSYTGFNFRNARHFQFMTGAVVTMFDSRRFSLAFLPALLIRAPENLSFQYDVQAGFLINNMFYMGALYRNQDAVGMQLGLIFNDLRLGISYDYTTGVLKQAGSYGSPEIILSYVMPLVKKTRWEGRCYNYNYKGLYRHRAKHSPGIIFTFFVYPSDSVILKALNRLYGHFAKLNLNLNLNLNPLCAYQPTS